MPNARVICARPRTITRIFPFFVDKKAKRPINPEGLEYLSLASIVPLDFTETVFEQIQGALKTEGAIVYNNTEYRIEDRDGEIVFCRGEEQVKHADGILQDSASGELFYFLAIDNPEQRIDTRKLDEGSRINYDRAYRGVMNIKLYKGNVGHQDTQKEMLERLRKEVEQLHDGCGKDDELTPTEKMLLEALEQGLFDGRPLPVAEETVRYVEVTGIQDHL